MQDIKQFFRQRLSFIWPKLSYIYWLIKIKIPFLYPKLLKDIDRVLSSNIEANSNEKKILFFHQSNGVDNLSFQIIISKALELRKNTIEYFIGDIYFPNSCNLGIYPKLDYFRYLQYKLLVKKIINLSNINSENTSSYFSILNRDKILSHIKNLSENEIKNFKYKNNNIFTIALPSVLHFLRAENIDFKSSLDKRVLLETMSNICEMYDTCVRYLEMKKPNIVCLVNGLHWPAASMVLAAKNKNIKFVTTEEHFRVPYEGNFHSSFLLDVNSTSIEKLSNASHFKNILKNTDNKINYDVLDEFLKSREETRTETITYASKSNQNNNLLNKLKVFSEKRKTFVLFTGIGWDSAYRYAASSAFTNSEEWLVETAKYFKKSEANLIIRIHPAENYSNFRMKKKTINSIKDYIDLENIFVIDSKIKINAYSLMDLVSGGITWASTTGLEMAMRGLPVITAFDRIYTQLGCSFDPRSKKDYFECLDKLLNFDLDIDREKTKIIAREIAYHYFIGLNHPLKFITRGFDYDLPSLNFNSLSELNSGLDKSLDNICELIAD